MSWSRASLLSMEKSGSSGASGRWGKAMTAVTGATGWKKGDALRSEVAGSGPGKCRMALLQVRAQNPKETPQAALARQPHWRNEWPATSRPDSCSQRDLASGLQPLYPAPPLPVHFARPQDSGLHLQRYQREGRFPRPPGSPALSSTAQGTRKRTASWKGHLKTRGNASTFQFLPEPEASVPVIKRFYLKLTLKGTPNSPSSRKEALGTCSIFRTS